MADSKEEAATRVDAKVAAATMLEKAKDFKAQGTKFFKDGEYVKAIYNYRKIFEILEGEEMFGEHWTRYEAERKDLVQAGRLNIALCWMKLKEWKRAKTMCTKKETNIIQ